MEHATPRATGDQPLPHPTAQQGARRLPGAPVNRFSLAAVVARHDRKAAALLADDVEADR